MGACRARTKVSRWLCRAGPGFGLAPVRREPGRARQAWTTPRAFVGSHLVRRGAQLGQAALLRPEGLPGARGSCRAPGLLRPNRAGRPPLWLPKWRPRFLWPLAAPPVLLSGNNSPDLESAYRLAACPRSPAFGAGPAPPAWFREVTPAS